MGVSIRRTINRAFPINVGDETLVPESEAISVELGSFHFVWQRPTAVTIWRDRESRRLMVVDVTLIAQLTIALSALVAIIRIRRQGGSSRRRN
jgi:hypothetical protein